MPCWPLSIVFSESSRGTYCLVSNIFQMAQSCRHRGRLSLRRICGCCAASPAVCKVTAEGTHRFRFIIIIKSYYFLPNLESLSPGCCLYSYLMTFNCSGLCRIQLGASRSWTSPSELLGCPRVRRWRQTSRMRTLSEAHFVVTFNEIFRISFNYLVLNHL